MDLPSFRLIHFFRWSLFGIFSALTTYYVYSRGIQSCPDAYTYGKLADLLIGNGFNPVATMQNAGNGMMFPLRIAFVVVVSLLKILFGANWQVALVSLNVFVTLFSLYYLLQFVESLALCEAAKVMPFLLIFLALDIPSWARYPISDSLYVGIHCIFFTFLFRRIKDQNFLTPLHAVTASILFLFIIFSRPTSLVYPIALCLFGVSIFFQKLSPKLFWLYFVPCLIGFGLLSILFFSHFAANLDLPSIKEKNLALFVIVENMRDGVVIIDRAETWLAMPTVTMDYFYLIIYKVGMFFNPILNAFSLKHNLINGVFFFSSYIFTLVAIFRSMTLTEFNRSIIFFVTFFILITAVYHAITIIDYDWRYRFPIVPILLLSSAIGFDILVKKATSVWNARVLGAFEKSRVVV